MDGPQFGRVIREQGSQSLYQGVEQGAGRCLAPFSVFGSYKRSWDAFAGIPLSDGLMDFVEEKVVTSRYKLETKVLEAGGYPLIGFAGTCTYRVMADDPVREREVNALADFALFAGTGMKTT
ncbi:MAG: CRISPR system precrRNA processing endoribonuclease RAMP protein Cas6, partial [Anaerolineae bacterium]